MNEIYCKVIFEFDNLGLYEKNSWYQECYAK